MSDVIEVSGDWLALREAEDARARSRALAEAAARLLPDGPVSVHDLGSGTGSMMRWLAPILPGPQSWTLHDWNAALTAQAAENPAPRSRDGRPVLIHTRTGELGLLKAGHIAGASLVTVSALLDVLTEAEADAIVDACVAVGAPVLCSLSVVGEVVLSPEDPRDQAVGRAFNAHQQRDAEGRILLGPTAPGVIARLFARAGWHVELARTEWLLDAHAPQLLLEWFDGWVGAAAEQAAVAQDPDLGAWLPAYRELRAEQLRRDELVATVAHLDLLAVPR